MENQKTESAPGNLSFLKGLTVVLLILLTVQVYHHRQWFRNIPEKAGTRKSAAASTAKPAPPVTAPAQGGKGVVKKMTALLPGGRNPTGSQSLLQASRFDSLWTALGAVKRKSQRTEGDSGKILLEERVELPRGRPLPDFAMVVNRLVESGGLKIDDAYEESRDSSLIIIISGDGKTVRKLRLTRGAAFLPGSARAALVMEGFGAVFTPSIQALFSSIKVPVTIGLVPNAKFTGEIARLARQNGWEIVCQIPMETVPHVDLGPGAIYKHYDGKKVLAALNGYQTSLASFDGYSIYQRGIRIVENEPDILKALLKQALREKRYFIDNSFAARSRVAEFAKPLGVNAQPPLGYVDQLPGVENHVKAARRYAELVRKTGSGILLFKNGAAAAESMKKILPLFETLGIQPVFVSSLYQ